MKLYTVKMNGAETLLVSLDGGKTAYALRDLGYYFRSMNQLIQDITPEQVAALNALKDGPISAPVVEWDSVKLCAPIPSPRQDVICLGINYDEHAKEAGGFSEEAFGGERPYTIYFSKQVNVAPGSGDCVPSYEGLVDSLDYEAELGVILKKDTKAIKPEEADGYIFGYTIVNDISARNLQTRHKQWYIGKSLDGFTPMGPCIVTADEIGDAGNLNISCTVNGELRQNSNTRYMIQTVAGAISELSQGITLQSGTIIATGTPAGVGMGMKPPKFLKHGDVVVCEIEKIGKLENTID